MMKFSCHSLLVVGFFISFVCVGFGQDRNSVTGFVFGEGRSPVARLNVELQTEFYSTVARTQTSATGMYSFRGLPSGSYMVKVLTGGTMYEEQSKSVSLIPISAVAGRGAVAEQVDFYLTLKKRPGENLKAPGVIFFQEVPQPAKDLYENAVADLNKKNEEEAYSKLRQALEIFPDYYDALDRLGSEYLAKGYFEPAFILFTKAVAVNSRSVSSGLGLGVAGFRLNHLENALGAFDGVLKHDRDNINAHYWKGIVLHASKKLEASLTSLLRAEKLGEKKLPDVYWQLARVYKDLNRFRESANALESYLKLMPNANNAEEIKQIIKTLKDRAGS